MEMLLKLPIRIFSVFLVIAKWGIRQNAEVHGTKRELDGPYRTLLILEELGGVFLKFGQIFAMRLDLIPARYAVVLMNLFSNVTAQPNHLFFKGFKKATGKSMKKVFDGIETNPIGVASFAQVYKGVFNGTTVAIKIQKPDADQTVREDLMALRFFIGFLKRLGFLKNMSIDDLIEQLTLWLRQELDYRVEAANLVELGEQVKKRGLEKRVRIPRIFAQFTTKTTLVEEFFDGVPVGDIINGRATLSEPECLRVANAFLHDLMRQYFVDGFFHADPHPGNLLVFPDKRIGYIDFGMMGRATVGPVHLLRFILGVIQLDTQYATDGLMRFAQLRLKKDARELFLREPRYQQAAEIVINFIIRNLSKELEPIMEGWHRQVEDMNLAAVERSSATPFFKMITAFKQYGMIFPRDVIGFIRALLIVDMVCLNLAPKFNMREAVRGFFDEFPIDRVERENPWHATELARKDGGQTFSPDILANTVGREGDIEYQESKKDKAIRRREHTRQKLIYQIGALAEKYPELYTALREVL